MKYHLPKNEKPIKYKEFIQEIQNSSRSSSHDLSLLSQRSFRESNTFRESIKSDKKGDKSQFKENNNILIDDSSLHDNKEEEKVHNEEKENQSKENHITKKEEKDTKDKLYTFCDAKLTERSIEIRDKENRPLNEYNQLQEEHSHKVVQLSHSENCETKNDCHFIQKPILEQKFFRTNKQKTDHKENINFVNSILEKVDSLHSANKQNHQNHLKLSEIEESMMFLKHKESESNILPISCEAPQHNSLYSSQQNTQRKIESVKKVSLKHPVQSCQKIVVASNESNQKSRESSFSNIKKKGSQINLDSEQKEVYESKEKEKNPSSKKKIVSLNINSLKPNKTENYNKIKLKLSMDRSLEKEKNFEKVSSENKSKFKESQNCSLIEGKNLMHGSLVSENTRMGSLEQSKIEVINHDFSNQNLLMSGNSLTELTNIFVKEQNIVNNEMSEEIGRLYHVINEQKEREKELSKELYELNQKLKSFKEFDDKREIEILQKDCYRLTTSYKEIKKLYECEVQSKIEILNENQNLMNENEHLKEDFFELKEEFTKEKEWNTNLKEENVSLKEENNDLKDCLRYKETFAKELENKVIHLSKQIREMQEQLSYPSELEGLSDIIKEKISQYEESISNYEQEIEQYRSENIQLRDENDKLLMIREKLENFTTLLKEEIEEKDNLIDEYESQLKQLSQLRRSIKSENQMNEMTETKLRLKLKEMESKLKLANTHIEYLTKQIVDIKHENNQEKQNISSHNLELLPSKRCLNPILENSTVKSTHLTTIANTITTRNSSITHLDIMNKNLPYQESLRYKENTDENEDYAANALIR